MDTSTSFEALKAKEAILLYAFNYYSYIYCCLDVNWKVEIHKRILYYSKKCLMKTFHFHV